MTWRKVCLIVLAVLLAVLTVLLSTAAVRIFQEGTARKAADPLAAVYTQENVRERLISLSPLIAAVAVMTLAGLLLGVRDENSVRPVFSPETERDLLEKRLSRPGEAVLTERKRQRTVRWLRWTAFAACMVPILLYLLDKGHFPENDLEGMIAALTLHTLPWAALGLLLLLIGYILEKKSIFRQIDAARAQLQAEKGGRSVTVTTAGQSGRGITAVRVALLTAAGAFILFGVLNGSLDDVLLKAINICTECIGLG